MEDLNNSGKGKLLVPGYGIDIDLEPENEHGDVEGRFRHGASDFCPARLTVREVAMLKFMDAITDKPNWNTKVFDEAIVNKWKAEAAQQPKTLLSEKTFEWCIKELRDRAKDFERDGFIRTYESASRCVKSDHTIPLALRDKLRKAVEPLLQVDDTKKDWHPNSNEQVLNLVHPSLFPLVYGKSRVLTTGQVGLLDCLASSGKGAVVPGDQLISATRPGQHLQEEVRNGPLWSNQFQWLPAEVKFTGQDGTDVKITSYINNLHPIQHNDLYAIIETFISKSIPLWNEVLVKESGRAAPRINTCGAESDPEEPPSFYSDKGFDFKALKEYLALPDNPDWESDGAEEVWSDDEEWLENEATEWKFARTRKISHPEPGVSFSYEQWKSGDGKEPVIRGYWGSTHTFALDSYTVKLEEDFREQGLQVIVKLSSIELSPEKPAYPGGNWHIEGMLNEHIVATAIYYYDVENVTDSRLRLRQEAWLDSSEMSYRQGDHGPLAVVFGMNTLNDEAAVQELGAIVTKADRLLVFPNTLQHKVEPFELADRSKPGHRRFLVLWLVDPHYRIMSTANVPPQQTEWVQGAVADADLVTLPQELQDMVSGFATNNLTSLEDAKAYRLELMKERTLMVDAVENNFEEYNFCEH